MQIAVTLDHKTVRHNLIVQDNSLLVLSKNMFSLDTKTFVVSLAGTRATSTFKPCKNCATLGC